MTGAAIVANADILFLLSIGLAACGWASIFASWRMDARTKRRRDEHARDAAFVAWSRWTLMSVTDRHGMIYTRSLYELQDEPDDLIWTTPITVAVFRSGPDVDDQEHEEDNARGRAA